MMSRRRVLALGAMLAGIAAADSIPKPKNVIVKMRTAAREVTATVVPTPSPALSPIPVMTRPDALERTAVHGVASTPLRQLHSPQNMKEFMPDAHGHVFHGSCQQLAMLGGLHAVDPSGYPMNGKTLGDIVHWTIDHGVASASGSSAPRAARAYFSAHGIAYQDYTVSQLDAVLATYGGRMPIIIEVSRAYNLPGDEKGVQNHYICAVGFNTADKTVPCVDGDNIVVRRSPDGYGQLNVYKLSDIHNAAPIHVMLVRKTLMIDLSDPAISKYYQQVSAGWQNKQNGVIIQTGSMLDYYRTMPNDEAGLHDLGLVLSDEIPVSGTSAKVQVYERGALAYDPQRQIDDPPGVDGDVYLAHVDKGAANTWIKQH